MASGFEITCVNKNPNGMIVRIGGAGWTLSLHEAIVKLTTQEIRLNLLLDDQYVDIGIRGDASDAYLVIEPEGQPLHEVIDLPGCSV